MGRFVGEGDGKEKWADWGWRRQWVKAVCWMGPVCGWKRERVKAPEKREVGRQGENGDRGRFSSMIY